MKPKQGQVAILVYGRRTRAVVHRTVSKSCENRHPDSSRDRVMPLKNCSNLDKFVFKNPTLASCEDSMKIHRRLLSWVKHVDSVIIQVQKRLNDLQEAEKTREKKITRGSQGVELGSGSQGQEMNHVCQRCEVAEINKQWQIRQCSCCVEGKDCSSSVFTSCKGLTYWCVTHPQKRYTQNVPDQYHRK